MIVELTEDELRAVLDVVGPAVSRGASPDLGAAEFKLDSALLECEQKLDEDDE